MVSYVEQIQISIITYFNKYLGRGNLGKVFKVKDKSNININYAMKEITLKNQSLDSNILSELEIMKGSISSTSGCVKLLHIHLMNSIVYIIYPLCQEGGLFTSIAANYKYRSNYNEMEISIIIKDIINGIQYLHSKGIPHLSIKPENILCQQKQDKITFLLSDFGLNSIFNNVSSNTDNSRRNSDNKSVYSEGKFYRKLVSFVEQSKYNIDNLTGGFGFMSPEQVLLGYKGVEVDVFSIGTVLYTLLCGYPPFHAQYGAEILLNSVTSNYSFSGSVWESISGLYIHINLYVHIHDN